MPSGLRAVASASVCFLLTTGLYWSIRLGLADFYEERASLDHLRRAVSLAPGNARYLANLSLIEADQGLDPSPALLRAAASSGLDSEIWLGLAVNAERRQNYRAAEGYFLRAAAVDRQFRPRWNLASYYFRRNNAPEFWKWVRPALAIAPDYGTTALFRLCWLMSQDADWILANEVPDQSSALSPYVSFLIANGRLEAAGKAAQKLIPVASQAHVPQLLDYCDKSVLAGKIGSALLIWNTLSARRLILQNRIDPERGPWIANGDFAEEPLNSGFDWRLSPGEGISIFRPPGGLRVELSGKQPEASQILAQFLALTPGRRFAVKTSYDWSGKGTASGLKWRLQSPVGGRIVPPLSESSFHEGPGRAETVYSIPSDADSAQLSLVYERVAGTVRIEGSLALSKIEVEPAR